MWAYDCHGVNRKDRTGKSAAAKVSQHFFCESVIRWPMSERRGLRLRLLKLSDRDNIFEGHSKSPSELP